MRRIATIAAAAAMLAIGVPAAAQTQAGANMEQVLGDQRRADDRARDQYRNPAETLAFFGVEPGMTVVDYMPAGGWYTRVLVPYLGTQGRYIGLTPDPAASDVERMAEYFAALPARFREASPGWNLSGAPVEIYASQELPEALAGTADRVLIFREMHNLHRSGVLHTELTRIHSLLDEDGMLGIVQHRAKPWADASYTDGSKGYMRQEDVIGLVEAHGFELVGTSEVNANPRDMADHEGGVWEMPPSLSTKRDDLRNLGESDRMTLLFRKR